MTDSIPVTLIAIPPGINNTGLLSAMYLPLLQNTPSNKRQAVVNILFCISTLSASLSAVATQHSATSDSSDELLQINNSPLTNAASLAPALTANDYSWFRGSQQFELSALSSHRALFKTSEPVIGAAMRFEVGSQYDINARQQIWTDGEELTEHGERLLELALDPAKTGLPDFFSQNLANALNQNIHSIHNMVPTAVGESELDKLFDRLVHAVGSGVVDPLNTQKEWMRESDAVDPKQLRKQILSGLQSLDEAIDSITPQNLMYKSLQKMLVKLENLDQAKQTFVPSERKLEQGMEDPVISTLKKALTETGDYESRAITDDKFSKDLTMAVERFQVRHGLEVNGIVSKATFKALNTPIQYRIDQVKANMERWRWFPAKLEQTHILVNIPEYRLRMQHDEEPLFEMDIVVGKPKHMTPIFSETMKHVVFAPTWTVPTSITDEELIPKELRSPGYLKSEEIDFFIRTSKGLKRIDRNSITPETLLEKPFRYTLRQRAGDKNVLGKVKFLMPNKHAIYLHDTQAKKLFGEAERAFSHGCIRLANPDLMAYVIMQLDGYGQSEVRDFMALQDTTTVDLEKHIPVHMAYFTAWQDDSGKMHFREDIYKQDERLIKAMHNVSSANSHKKLAIR